MDWEIHVLYLGDITIPKAMGTIGLDMHLVFPAPYLAFLLASGGRSHQRVQTEKDIDGIGDLVFTLIIGQAEEDQK